MKPKNKLIGSFIVSVVLVVGSVGASTIIPFDESILSGPFGLMLGAILLGLMSFGLKPSKAVP